MNRLRHWCAVIAMSLGAYCVPAQAIEQAPVTTVVRLYRDFAWEAVFDTATTGQTLLIDQPATVLKIYFTHRLAKLLVEDRRCAVRTREICKLDFQPIWASQDSAAMDLKIETETPVSNVVTVKYRYPSTGELLQMKYDLTHTAAGWRISDIRYQSGISLLGVLEAKRK